jgi:hypothetical protein
MKVKDLPSTHCLVGVRVKIPKKYEDKYSEIFGSMFIYSYWNKGIWFKKSMEYERIYPLSIDPKEVLEWTIASQKRGKK